MEKKDEAKYKVCVECGNRMAFMIYAITEADGRVHCNHCSRKEWDNKRK